MNSATTRLVEEIARLPNDWHGAGTFTPRTFNRLVALLAGGGRPIRASAETGTGKSTLLLSHLSERHTVFAKDDRGDGDSLARVQSSPLLSAERVSFVVGPTQQTLPAHSFTEPLDVVLLDGPHAYPFPELEYYFLYPHLAPGALLVVDDVHIATVRHLVRVLREDPMYEHVETVENTTVLRRTDAPTFDPLGDGWWMQPFNARRRPLSTRVAGGLPRPVKELAKRVLRR